MKTVAIGSDHAGYELKEVLKNTLEELGFQIKDFGTNSPESTDYPDYAHPVAMDVEQGKADFGVVICGSGNGVAMAANKHRNIRCALCWNEELAALARQHNDANILAIPSRFVSEDLAVKMLKTFAKEEFEGGRHARRVNKIGNC